MKFHADTLLVLSYGLDKKDDGHVDKQNDLLLPNIPIGTLIYYICELR